MKILFITMFLISILFNGCGSGGTSENTNTTTPIIKTISGVAVDGYLLNAKICLDINENDYCDNNEPSTTTSNDGKYSFETTLNGIYTILVVGGVDTATNQSFYGILKDIIEVDNTTTKIDSTINLLTTSAANIYNNAKNNNINITIDQAKEKVANYLDITKEQVSGDPMKDTTIFIKTQQIVQTIQLVTSKINTTDKKDIFNKSLESISDLMDNSDKFNISEIANNIAVNNNIVLNENIESFITLYTQEFETKAYTYSDNLATLQNSFQSLTDSAEEKINNDDTDNLNDIIRNIQIDILSDFKPPQIPTL